MTLAIGILLLAILSTIFILNNGDGDDKPKPPTHGNIQPGYFKHLD